MCVFLYDKCINKFILELRGTNNSQYKEKASPISGKRKRHFVISRRVINELNKIKSFKKILLKINRDEISEALNSHDGFEDDFSVELKNWNPPKCDNINSNEIFI